MNNYLRKIFPLCLVLLSFTGMAQKKYWITFTDKDIQNYRYDTYLSPQAIQKRINLNIPLFQYSDIPLTQAYLDSLGKLDIQPVAKSRWFNSITADLTQSDINILNKISFVKSVEPVNTKLKISSVETELETRNYSITLEQMKSKTFVDSGLSGRNVMVGVIDAGFYSADREPRLIHLFDEKKIQIQRDFINPERSDLIESSVTLSDDHGKKVLDYLCGYYITERIQTGLGVNAKFHLARTENGDREHRGEEDHWIMALEWMDSLGVRLINTSLGYAINMDDPADNYKREDMNGKTTRISKAAQLATEEKGIFLVVSAGNEGGNRSWSIISAPADAEGVLSVGATDESHPTRIYYSSVGPDFLPYLKPNVSAFSPNGTSFSAPAVAGFVSCIIEKDSTLSNKQIKEIMEKSAHLYPYGNNFIGYGIPQADRALMLLSKKDTTFNTQKMVVENDTIDIYFKPSLKRKKAVVSKKRGDAIVYHKKGETNSLVKKGEAVVFHKKNGTIVMQQELIPVKKKKITLVRRAGQQAATVSFENEVVEVVWQK